MSKPTVVISAPGTGQCRNPTGWLGRLLLRTMNARHSKVTDWGLSRVVIDTRDLVLDVGCGGGRTVAKLSAMASDGRIAGVDYSKDAVTVALRTNRQAIAAGRVEIRQASVSSLPFAADTFNVVTAVETHFWWPDLPGALREILRVLKPAGTLVIISEIYKGAHSATARFGAYLSSSGMAFLTVEEHRGLIAAAGYADVEIATDAQKGWICCVARKP
jgi:SAM-dependent methyltransferase